MGMVKTNHHLEISANGSKMENTTLNIFTVSDSPCSNDQAIYSTY
jgi:hypothetical protein